MKYKLVIFDLDGTILDTLEDLSISLNHALSVNGFPERTYDEARRFVGNGIRKLIERAVPENTSAEDTDKVYNDFHRHYSEHSADHTRPYDGINDLLERLKKNGIITAVVSNKADYAVQDLCKKYFNGLFDYIAGEKSGVRRKPYPDAVIAVLEKFGVSGDQAVYIGDSEVDILTAANACIDSVIVDWGFRDREMLEENGASLIVSTIGELENSL